MTRAARCAATIAARAALVPLLGLLAADPGRAVDAAALLTASAEAETPLKAKESLRVVALPVAPGRPVIEATVLVAVDVTELEKALAEARARHASAVATERQRTANANESRQSERLTRALADQQDSATREMPELQNRLVSAPVRAPADGYFVRSLHELGTTTRKRKPAALFVPVEKTLLELRLPASAAAPFASARHLVVASKAGPAASFRGRVEGSATEGDQLVLRVKPLELPFLTLGEATPVSVEPAP